MAKLQHIFFSQIVPSSKTNHTVLQVKTHTLRPTPWTAVGLTPVGPVVFLVPTVHGTGEGAHRAESALWHPLTGVMGASPHLGHAMVGQWCCDAPQTRSWRGKADVRSCLSTENHSSLES